MSLNWKEINIVLSELELEGAQIQKIFQPGYDTLALQIYGRAKTRLILVCLAPGACRIHETFRAVPKSEKPLRFAEFLKARILNGRVEEAIQLGDNRILRLSVRRGENRYCLYARLWSNAANVIVTDDEGTILDAMRRLPKRGEVTGGIYRPEAELTGKAETEPAGATAAAALPPPNEDKYKIREFPEAEPGLSFNKKIDRFYSEEGGALSLEKLKEQAERLIGRSASRLEAALERLREKEAEYRSAGRLKEMGDMILANAARIEGGAEWFEAPAWAGEKEGLDAGAAVQDESGGVFRIELDRTKSPVENAQSYYEKYRKAKTGLEDVQNEIKEGETELLRLGEMEQRLLAETNPHILQRLLQKFGKGKPLEGAAGGKAETGGRKRPGLAFKDGDWLLLVGRDGRENDELLRRHVKGNDLWLHARDYAGSFVFVKYRSGKSVPLEILLDAGNLAVFYSKGRNNGAGNCYYTQVKYLRRAKDGPPGKVLPSQEKNLFIKLDQKRLKKLEDTRLRY